MKAALPPEVAAALASSSKQQLKMKRMQSSQVSAGHLSRKGQNQKFKDQKGKDVSELSPSRVAPNNGSSRQPTVSGQGNTFTSVDKLYHEAATPETTTPSPTLDIRARLQRAQVQLRAERNHQSIKERLVHAEEQLQQEQHRARGAELLARGVDLRCALDDQSSTRSALKACLKRAEAAGVSPELVAEASAKLNGWVRGQLVEREDRSEEEPLPQSVLEGMWMNDMETLDSSPSSQSPALKQQSQAPAPLSPPQGHTYFGGTFQDSSKKALLDAKAFNEDFFGVELQESSRHFELEGGAEGGFFGDTLQDSSRYFELESGAEGGFFGDTLQESSRYFELEGGADGGFFGDALHDSSKNFVLEEVCWSTGNLLDGNVVQADAALLMHQEEELAAAAMTEGEETSATMAATMASTKARWGPKKEDGVSSASASLMARLYICATKGEGEQEVVADLVEQQQRQRQQQGQEETQQSGQQPLLQARGVN